MKDVAKHSCVIPQVLQVQFEVAQLLRHSSPHILTGTVARWPSEIGPDNM